MVIRREGVVRGRKSKGNIFNNIIVSLQDDGGLLELIG